MCIRDRPKDIDQGELLNLKADLKMLLDTMDKSAARMRLGQELEKALETGNGVKAWLLGACLLYTSRCV